MNVLIGTLALLVGPSLQDPVLTLDEALRIAESNAFSVRIAAANVEKSKQVRAEARSQLGPKLTAGATYTRFDKAITSQFGEGDPVVVRPIDTKNATFNLQIPLLFSKALNLGVEAAEFAIKANAASAEATRVELKLSVRTAYYQAVQAKWQVDVAAEAVENAKKRLANAEIRERAGELAKIDVLRFKTELSQREGDLILAKNGLDLAKNNLNNVLGRPVDTPFQTDEIPGIRPAVAGEKILTEAAQKTRPDIESLRQQLNGFVTVRKIESKGKDPSLNLSVNHVRNIDAIGFGSVDAQTTGVLALSIPIVDSGLTKARTRQAEQDVVIAETRLKQAELGVALAVRQANTRLQNALAQLDIAEDQLALATETYRLAVVRYEAGEGIQLEIIDAQTQLTAAQTNRVAARYNVLIAYAELQAAVGTDSLPAPSTAVNNGDNT